jgi:hypothetical protein
MSQVSVIVVICSPTSRARLVRSYLAHDITTHLA